MPSNDEIVHQLPMRWADLDSLNHVNNVVYVDYAAESRALLVEDGLIETGHDVIGMSARYVRPLLLSQHPVLVVSQLEADTLTQQICSDRDGTRTVYAELTTALGTLAPMQRSDIDAAPLPSKIRRSDLASDGTVSQTKMFELFQEGRVLFISNHLTTMSAGQFVVGTVEVAFHQPISWRREPYEMRSWISRVGTSSIRIESELSDGEAVFAAATSYLIGFDLAAQKSRAFSPDERAVFEGMVLSEPS